MIPPGQNQLKGYIVVFFQYFRLKKSQDPTVTNTFLQNLVFLQSQWNYQSRKTTESHSLISLFFYT